MHKRKHGALQRCMSCPSPSLSCTHSLHKNHGAVFHFIYHENMFLLLYTTNRKRMSHVCERNPFRVFIQLSLLFTQLNPLFGWDWCLYKGYFLSWTHIFTWRLNSPCLGLAHVFSYEGSQLQETILVSHHNLSVKARNHEHYHSSGSSLASTW